MKCRECEKEGQRSELRVTPGLETCMCDEFYFDEDGRAHHHDPNGRSATYRCSRGHVYSETSYPRCQVEGCSWNDRTQVRSNGR